MSNKHYMGPYISGDAKFQMNIEALGFDKDGNGFKMLCGFSFANAQEELDEFGAGCIEYIRKELFPKSGKTLCGIEVGVFENRPDGAAVTLKTLAA